MTYFKLFLDGVFSLQAAEVASACNPIKKLSFPSSDWLLFIDQPPKRTGRRTMGSLGPDCAVVYVVAWWQSHKCTGTKPKHGAVVECSLKDTVFGSSDSEMKPPLKLFMAQPL